MPEPYPITALTNTLQLHPDISRNKRFRGNAPARRALRQPVYLPQSLISWNTCLRSAKDEADYEGIKSERHLRTRSA
jgi:hypothetical protein